MSSDRSDGRENARDLDSRLARYSAAAGTALAFGSTRAAPLMYAWAHIDSIADSGTSYHVDGYAYRDDGQPIKAGQTVQPVPEPSTIALALLASGAAGVMASRRKKMLKGRGQGWQGERARPSILDPPCREDACENIEHRRCAPSPQTG